MGYERGQRAAIMSSTMSTLPIIKSRHRKTVKFPGLETRLQELGHSRLNTDYHLLKAPLLLCGAIHYTRIRLAETDGEHQTDTGGREK